MNVNARAGGELNAGDDFERLAGGADNCGGSVDVANDELFASKCETDCPGRKLGGENYDRCIRR
jgi:hypothetical protein